MKIRLILSRVDADKLGASSNFATAKNFKSSDSVASHREDVASEHWHPRGPGVAAEGSRYSRFYMAMMVPMVTTGENLIGTASCEFKV